ncbi:membrane-anchored mycosin MYCP [Actinopolyspora biskrensis]|uniref:Membrane-anchored mycosin MYCP n=1 Tax=Actinopolyspora biskrensis TaxID=1470178 RepID=A0A852Z4M4_9ACTN|nr:type VII secretion-associated serine protease mycosin [Actinopolyspora biskrensis]NYH78546.1 membrane-anchored mycosin MYCP [Actinopolyspora biskrensis]
MRSTTFARRDGLRRTLAMSAALGTFLLCGAVPPAAAQDAGSTETGDQPFAPPPLNPEMTARSGLQVDGSFQQQQACMQAGESGATIEEQPWSQRLLGFQRAHEQGLLGTGQTVAVIDTGVNEHPRLKPGLEPGGSKLEGGALKDCDGHGTIVAGIISAERSDETGFVGIAPESTVLSLRQSSALYKKQDDGNTPGTTETMARAINHAVDNGASVINISQSSCQSLARASNPADRGNQKLHNAVRYAYERDVVVVAAAGNTGGQCQKNAPGSPSTAVLPAWFDKYVLTVASVNEHGAPSEFTVPGPWVDVSAPGEDLVSLDPGAGASGLVNRVSHGSDSEPQPIQGTSFAAPYVSGLAALVKEKDPSLTAEQVMRRITETAQRTGSDNDIVGHGLINPMAAINNVIPAEHNAAAPPTQQRHLQAHVFPERNWAAIAVALGGAVGGLATVLFTAFLVNAVRRVRARNAGTTSE